MEVKRSFRFASTRKIAAARIKKWNGFYYGEIVELRIPVPRRMEKGHERNG